MLLSNIVAACVCIYLPKLGAPRSHLYTHHFANNPAQRGAPQKGLCLRVSFSGTPRTDTPLWSHLHVLSDKEIELILGFNLAKLSSLGFPSCYTCTFVLSLSKLFSYESLYLSYGSFFSFLIYIPSSIGLSLLLPQTWGAAVLPHSSTWP